MKTRKIVSIWLMIAIVSLTFNCADENGTTISLTDVSSRITGFGTTITGAGAELSVTGTRMDKVVRVFVGNLVVPAKLFTNVTEGGFTFVVPAAVGLGENDVLFVWPGSERGTTSIEVVKLQAINSFHPTTVSDGETVTVVGANMSIVESVAVDGVAGVITEKADNFIKFTAPTSVSTGKITLISPAGEVNSATDLVSCNESDDQACIPGLNLNSSFEDGTDDNFDNWGKYNGGAFMFATTNANEVFRGSRALKVIRDGSLLSGEWRIQLASDLVTTTSTETYTVSAMIKASSAGGSLRFSTQPTAQYQGNVNITTEWMLVSWTITASDDATRILMDMNGNNTAVTTFFIDDFKIVKN